jgi:GTP cyclohydrolase II/3,4-dihydroxy 2-butanone 4-phosphate synthase/GTP cyclohydrolase II
VFDTPALATTVCSLSEVARYADADVPTEYGTVRTVVYRVGEGTPPEEHVALVVGDVATGDAPVLARVHSECWTGEVLHSHKCDCRAQLDRALRAVADAGRGVVVYLRQEGRGIGLGNKVRAYALQSEGVDTVDANRILGFADDARTYDVAASILRDLGVHRVALMTNNPRKVQGLVTCGIEVAERVALRAEPNEHNAEYLEVKARRMGHKL